MFEINLEIGKVPIIKVRCLSVLIVLIVLIIMPSQSFAEFYTGKDLVALTREAEKADANTSDADWIKVQEYHAYLYGVCDATEFLYDLPANVNIRRISAAVSKYLKNHPKEWSMPAALLVVRALKEAFPSSKSK